MRKREDSRSSFLMVNNEVYVCVCVCVAFVVFSFLF